MPGELADRLLLAVPAFYSSSAPARITDVQHITNPYSVVYRVGLFFDSRHETVYAKVPNHTQGNLPVHQKRLQAEFDIMERLSENWDMDTPYGVVAPIAFYPDLPAIVTQAAPGTPMRKAYRSGARLIFVPQQRRSLLLAVKRCGTWLREFQEVTAKGLRPFDIDELESYCNDRIELLVKSRSRNFTAELADRLLASVRELVTASIPSLVPVAGRHNDFASHNIINESGSIRAIDFSMYDHAATAYDPCNFWFEIEMLKHDHTYSRRFLCRLQEEFLNGYGRISPEEPIFLLAQLRYTLNRLLTLWDEQENARSDLRYRQRVKTALESWLQRFASAETNQ